MLVLEDKAYGKAEQFRAVEEAIRTAQFIRNKCIRLWMDSRGVGKSDLSAYSAALAKEFQFAGRLISMARQAAAERAWSAIARFYAACKGQKPGKKPYPRFKKNSRSVEYKTSGWRLAEDRKRITFTDGNGIGTLKLKGTRDLSCFALDQIKRVRLICRADGYYVQFAVAVERREIIVPTQSCVGLDMGLESFYTDSRGNKIANPRFLRKAEARIKRLQRTVSRREKGGKNCGKARNLLAKAHLKVQRQRKDFAVKQARCVVRSHDLVAFEDLPVRNMVKSGTLSKSISDAAWSLFRRWLEYYGVVYGRVIVPVPPQYTSQNCSRCGTPVAKALSERTHRCSRCGLVLDRDHNAALNILQRGLGTVGRGTPEPNAWGETDLYRRTGDGLAASGFVEPGIPWLQAVGSVKSTAPFHRIGRSWSNGQRLDRCFRLMIGDQASAHSERTACDHKRRSRAGMNELLSQFIGKRVDIACLGMANIRGEVLAVDERVLRLKDCDGRICYVALDKVVAVWEARDNEHRAGFVPPKNER